MQTLVGSVCLNAIGSLRGNHLGLLYITASSCSMSTPNGITASSLCKSFCNRSETCVDNVLPSFRVGLSVTYRNIALPALEVFANVRRTLMIPQIDPAQRVGGNRGF